MRYEIRNDDKGVLDELIAHDVTTLHLERMDHHQWWLGINLSDGTRMTLWIHTQRANPVPTITVDQ